MEKSKLAQAREKLGWTQEKLAKKSGVAREHIATLEKNPEANPTKTTMEKIATALGMKAGDIFFT